MALINFFSKDIDFHLNNEKQVALWLEQVAEAEGEQLSDLNVIFTTDGDLLEINKQFLNHDYYTDIITFPGYGEVLSGESYISIDRVQENAKEMGLLFEDELNRVMVHGLLHILGFKDKTEEEEMEMRSKEDFYLNLRKF